MQFAVGVGHKPQSVPSMGRIDGTSRDNGRPDGVADAFQVSTHSVEPCLANRRRNLLSHDDGRPASGDEAEEDGPQVPLVGLAEAPAGDGEGLAGAGAGPERPIVRPSSQASREAPSPDAGEEMALSKARQIGWSNIDN
jgi:hypothetical protein